MKIMYLKLLLLIYSLGANAQNQIQANIIEEGSGKSIAFANVSIYTAQDSAFITGTNTDEKGKFQFNEIAAGNYYLLVQMIGYKDHYESFNCLSGKCDLPAQIAIGKESINLETITVSAERSRLVTQMGKKILYVGQDLTSSGGNVLDVLDNLPSVETNFDGSISVRGGSNVLIFINGRPSRKDGLALQQLPAESILKVELITNPSAKYDAEGISGIINIVFKRDSNKGTNLNTTAFIGIPERWQTGMVGNHKNDQFNFAINANVGENKNVISTVFSDRTTDNEAITIQRYINDVERKGSWHFWNINPSIEYTPDTSQQWVLNYQFNFWDDQDNMQQINDFAYNDTRQERITLSNKGQELENEFEIALSYNKDYPQEGRRLFLSIAHSGEDEDVPNIFNLENIDLSETPLDDFIKSSDTRERQRFTQLKWDYSLVKEKWGQIEMGSESTLIDFNVLQKLAFNDPAFMVPDNDFSILQIKNAAYLTYAFSFDRIDFNIGTRIEHFYSDAIQESLDSSFTQDFLNLFPSLAVSIDLDKEEKQQLSLTYSKRIQRPSFFDLNPYIYYVDPLNLEQGNPFLEPVFADSWELTHTLSAEKLDLVTTLYNRISRNTIQDIVFAEGEKTITTYTNFAQESNAGLEVVANLSPYKWLDLNTTFNLFHRSFTDNSDVLFNNNQTTWNLRIEPVLKFNNQWRLEMTSFYRSPVIRPQTVLLGNYYLNIALRKKIWNDRGSLILNISDAFATRRFVRETETDNYFILM
ncbi:MAG: outer membrane beta-barrel protein, partial [Bacteroidota bacterium]